MDNSILLAYSFSDDGHGKKLTGNAISRKVKADTLAWVHLHADHPDTKIWLQNEISYLDPLIIEALLADETRPRMTQIDDGVLLILRGANPAENAEPEDMISIRLWIDSHRIISLQKRLLKAVSDLESKLQLGKGPKNAGDFVCTLISHLFEHMEPVLSKLVERTDVIEATVLEAPNAALRESIIDIRKQAIIFKRYMTPQREAIGQLRMSDLSWLNEVHMRSLQENYNHITRNVEDLDAVRERAQIVKDELTNMLADRLNKNMYVLSVIAAIFLPLSFLTGLLGVNIAGLPGTENSYAFWIFCGLLISVVVIQVTLFKKLKWF